MKTKHFPKFVIPLVILTLAVAVYFLVTALSSKDASDLLVSGTIEAQSAVIAPEIGGKVAMVNVNEGDSVRAGDVLFAIDDTLLLAQRSVAEANLTLAQGAAATSQAALEVARANFDLALAAAKVESSAQRAADWSTANPSGYTLAGGSFTSAELIEAAQSEAEAAAAARSEAEDTLSSLLSDAANQEFVKAESSMLTLKFETQAAQSVLDQAAAAAEQAQGSVQQAQANLTLLDAQLSKLSITAPFDGVVLGRSVEVGEVLSPAAPAFSLGQLASLTITVYVPETEVGLLSINQAAQLAVDSYPGEVFSSTIIHIADQAEFTPRNVQTTEGRKTTVFAVKLQIANPDGKLKPGMPADVSFVK